MEPAPKYGDMLAHFPLPIYDGDWEAEHGLPNARAPKALLAQHHALLVDIPEYNGGYPALLKNALDWQAGPVEAIPRASKCLLGRSRLWSRHPRARWVECGANRSPDFVE